jgi:cell division protein FtsB
MPISEIIPYVGFIIAGAFVLGAGGIIASVHTTRLKIKNGYPLEGMWGQSLKPNTDKEAVARVQLLTQENAQLKAEVASMRERLETVERIVTDGGFRLTHEIERLRDGKEKVQ